MHFVSEIAGCSYLWRRFSYLSPLQNRATFVFGLYLNPVCNLSAKCSSIGVAGVVAERGHKIVTASVAGVLTSAVQLVAGMSYRSYLRLSLLYLKAVAFVTCLYLSCSWRTVTWLCRGVAAVIVSAKEFSVSVLCRVCLSVVSEFASRIPPHFRVTASSENKKKGRATLRGQSPACYLY